MLRQLRRAATIGRTLLQFGIDELLPRHHWPLSLRLLRYALFFWRNRHRDLGAALRLRLALEQLGPVFIKFGQMLSTRRDLLPEEYARELAKLQDRVAPFAGSVARSRIEKVLGLSLDTVFEQFDETALATASIAQVHTAVLRAEANRGQRREVVIKVTRPGIEQLIDEDMRLLETLAAAVALFPETRRLRPREVVAEYKKTIIDELDLLRESANAAQLRRNFEGSKLLYVPEIFPDWCRGQVMVMERIYGVPVSDIDQLQAHGVDLKVLAERGVEVFFTQVFRDSFFHADMHPGNIFVDVSNPADPTWIGIDCGIVGTLNRDDKRYLAENFLAFFNRDYRKVAELHVDSGWVPPDTNIDEFEVAIRVVCDPIFNKPLAEISFGHVLLNLFATARRFNMQVQPQLVLLQKTLLYIEGLGRQLYPQLDLWQTARPFLENWMNDQIGVAAVLRGIKQNLPYWGEKLPELPHMIYQALHQGRLLGQHAEAFVQRQHQAALARQRGYFGLAIGCMLMAAALLLRAEHDWPLLLGGGAIIAWLLGWRAAHRHPR